MARALCGNKTLQSLLLFCLPFNLFVFPILHLTIICFKKSLIIIQILLFSGYICISMYKSFYQGPEGVQLEHERLGCKEKVCKWIICNQIQLEKKLSKANTYSLYVNHFLKKWGFIARPLYMEIRARHVFGQNGLLCLGEIIFEYFSTLANLASKSKLG